MRAVSLAVQVTWVLEEIVSAAEEADVSQSEDSVGQKKSFNHFE
jgi:hypothetical protein